MSNRVIHRSSGVSTDIPATNQIVLGELAINTFDGKVFLKKNNGTESIVEVGASPFKLDTPDVTCPTASSNEETTVIVTINNYNSNYGYTILVTGGTIINNGSTIDWLLPAVLLDTKHIMTIGVTDGDDIGMFDSIIVDVLVIPAIDDQVLLYENSSISEFSSLDGIVITDDELVTASVRTLNVNNNIISSGSVLTEDDRLLIDGSIFEILTTGMGLSDTSAVDVLTSNTSGNGVAFSDITTPWWGFDGIIIDDASAGANSVAGFVDDVCGFIFDEAIAIKSFELYGGCSASVMHKTPKDLQFEYSDDTTDGLDGTWFDLGNNQTGMSWVWNVPQAFGVSNTTKHFAYRVKVTAISDGGSSVWYLAEINMFADEHTVATTSPILPGSISKAELITKTATSNVITQDIEETDFIGLKSIEVKQEYLNISTNNSTIDTLVTAEHIKTGDVVNIVDGVNISQLTIGVVTGSGGSVSIETDVDPFGDSNLIEKYLFEDNNDSLLDDNIAVGGSYVAGAFGNKALATSGVSPSSGNTYAINASNDITISCHIKATVSSGDNLRVIEIADGPTTFFTIGLHGGKYAICRGDGVNTVSTTAIDTGNFVHIAITSEANVTKLYVNGVQEGGDGTLYQDIAAGVMKLNAYYTGGYSSNSIIDQLEIYDRALTPSEINNLLTQTIASYYTTDTTSVTAGTTPTSVYKPDSKIHFDYGDGYEPLVNRVDTILSNVGDIIQVQCGYDDYVDPVGGRTLQTRVKMNNDSEKISKIYTVITKKV